MMFDTTDRYDIPGIRLALALLDRAAPGAELATLKSLCIDHGTWAVPENAADYSPVLYEVSLHGVPAITDTADTLPVNWCRAARNVLANLTPSEVAA